MIAAIAIIFSILSSTHLNHRQAFNWKSKLHATHKTHSPHSPPTVHIVHGADSPQIVCSIQLLVGICFRA